MGIEFRTVDTHKALLSADSHTAGTTHTCTVDHDGVEGADGGNFVFFCEKRHEFHHDCRSDCHTFGNVLAENHFFRTCGDETFAAGRAVVGHDHHFVAVAGYFVLKDDQVFVSCGQNAYHPVSGFLECLDDGEQGSDADTSAAAEDCSVALADVGGTAEGAYYILKFVACLECAYFAR